MMALGGTFKVDGPAGPLEVHVSAGTASGTLVTFRGKGMPSVTGRGRGALRAARRRRAEEAHQGTEEARRAARQTMPQETIEPRAADTDGEKPFFEKVKDLFG